VDTIDGIAREPERKRITGLSRVSWWRRERAGDAPVRVRLGPRSVGWRRSDLEKWVAARPTVASDADTGGPAATA
jgi:prophage regulatory protein